MNLPKREIALVAGIIVLCITGAVFFKIKAYKEKINATTIEAIDLNKIKNGTYEGFYDLDPVKATVSVSVNNHSIEKIDLISHENGRGEKAEILTELVVKNQTLDIDVITGATAQQ